MPEWLKGLAWKASIRVTVSGVRIPLSPPLLMSKTLISLMLTAFSFLSLRELGILLPRRLPFISNIVLKLRMSDREDVLMFSLFRLINPSYRYFKAVIVELAAGVFLILTIGFWLPIALRLGGILLILSFIFLAVAAVASDADETNEIRAVVFLSYHPAHLSESNIIHSIRTNEHPPQLTSVEFSDQSESFRYDRYRGFGIQTFLRSSYLSCIRSPCVGEKYEINHSYQKPT